tara:strand:- start:134 stop:754 length:621 start_codon:yes stop_codon:yes gene_type:complete
MIKYNQQKKIKKRFQTRHDRIMTVANAISISRILLSIPLILMFETISKGNDFNYWFPFILIVIIVLTDFLDGYVARKTEEITHFGKLIDPVADKISMMVVTVYLIITHKLPFLIFFIVLFLRDTFLIIIGVYLMFFQEEVFQSNTSGKWFIGLSSLMMVLFLFKEPLQIPILFLWTTYVFSNILLCVSTYEYVRRYMKRFKALRQN